MYYPRFWGWKAFVVAVIGIMLAEICARWILGLGDPPLSQADAEIEYLFKPGIYHRFGNLVYYNRWSMRSSDFPAHKSEPLELRVMVIGDSVVNGGGLTDQNDLATELLQKDLEHDLKRKVVVGNISAGSWGPPNQLAYIKRYGLFDADVMLIVLSSHDYADVPTYKPIVGVDQDFPAQAPWCALQELWTRYLPRYLPHYRADERLMEKLQSDSHDADMRTVEISMGALKEMIGLARGRGAKVLLVQYLERNELNGRRRPGYFVIRQVADELRLRTIDLGAVFLDAMDHGQMPYRDSIHPNAHGQRVMAATLLGPVKDVLAQIQHDSVLQGNVDD